MAWTSKFLLPIRQSFSQSRNFLVDGKIGPLKTWVQSFENKLQNRGSKFEYNLNIHTKYVPHCCLSGSKSMRGIFGASVMFGAVYCWPRFSYAMDGLDICADDDHLESFNASEGEDDRHKLWLLTRKLWLPVLFVVTLLVKWDNPFAVTTKILLLLFSTKPCPSSIYLFVEKLCHEYMRQKPQLYRSKSLHASRVEVQDYRLLLVARVEIREQNLLLIGILGSWWSLTSSLDLSFLAPKESSSSSL